MTAILMVADAAADDGGDKLCPACHDWLPHGEFTRDRSRKDGLSSKCRACQSKHRRRDEQAWRLADRTAYLDRATRSPAFWKNERCREQNRRTVAKYRLSNPHKVAAWAATASAVRSGLIAKPTACAVDGCARVERLHLHHGDYAEKLAVIPLCPAHHGAVHAGEIVMVAAGTPTPKIPAQASRKPSGSHRGGRRR